MLVFHAALATDGALLLWAERAGGLADHATLLDTLAELTGVDAPSAQCAPCTVRAQLPSRDGARLPSSPLLEDAASESDEPAQLVAWTVPALRLDADLALDLLAACGDGTRPPRPGLVPGPELPAVVQLLRIAGAVVLRQELLPDARWTRHAGDDPEAAERTLQARWAPLPGPGLRDALDHAARSLPDAARALDGAQGGAPRQLVERVVAALVDALVRARVGSSSVGLRLRPESSLHDRWLWALTSPDPTIAGPPDALDRLVEELGQWQQRLRRAAESPFRLCLRLEEPDDPGDLGDGGGDEDDAALPPQPWTLRYLLQARDDASIVVDVADAWQPRGVDAELLAARGFHVGEHVVAPLGEAAHLFEPIADSLGMARPASCELDTTGAHHFLAEVAPVLEQAGFGVFVPAWWRGRGGRFQLSLRAQLRTELTGGRRMLDALNLETLVEYDWRVALGDEQLTRAELTRMAAQKSGLVRIRGRWVELDAAELRAALAHLDRLGVDPTAGARQGAMRTSVGELVGMAMGAGAGVAAAPHGLPIIGIVDADGCDLAEQLAEAAREQLPELVEAPAGLHAELRPYQLRGYAWLATMARLGLGACLADDMGLGKTLQALAAIQLAWEEQPEQRAPTLIVCPTTVLTNWAREAERFTPELPALVHHGSTRAREAALTTRIGESAIVITSYALLARDIATLAQVDWRMVVLDEAQNIKNPGTRHAVAARSLRTRARVALTGTPVENHVGDLWSIMEFLNPGLLGSQADFRRRYMLPIQAGTFPEATERLRRLTSPFLMRRVKTDPAVIDDLPDKLESTAFCSMTTEQVSLYEAIVREAESTLRMTKGQARRSGIERRGVILATLSRLKQACNHPAQLLGDNSRVAGRSGKLARLEELLETVLELDERALVFTQFVEMGELLRRQLRDTFGREVLFLHGGTSRRERDRIVERFQDPAADAPPILVLSLKAGGSGLNLTAANHVFHFDRWWNPATEQQASDRAFRIGQTRDVQVHALVCSGTVEERIDRMLRQKREVADSVVGSGEQWIGELDDDEVLDLMRLRTDTLLQAGRLDLIDPKAWLRVSL